MSHSQWRIDLAQQISQLYEATAIVMVGSPAFNLADAYSDLDIVMFWNTIPSDDERSYIASQYGVLHVMDSFNHMAEIGLQDAAEVINVGDNKLKVDITHKTIHAQSIMIDEVVQHFDCNRKKLAQIRHINDGCILRGQEVLDDWRNRYLPMPVALIEALLSQYLHFWAYQPVETLVIERDDRLFARQLMSDSCERLLVALSAMNRVYPPEKTKHLDYVLCGLEQPENTYQRIQEICVLPIREAHLMLKQLIEDTFSLAEALGFDIAKQWQQYNTIRHANHTPIQLTIKEQ